MQHQTLWNKFNWRYENYCRILAKICKILASGIKSLSKSMLKWCRNSSQNQIQKWSKMMPKRPKSRGMWGDLGRDLETARWGFPFFEFFYVKRWFWRLRGYPSKSRVAQKRSKKFNTASFRCPGTGEGWPKVVQRASRTGAQKKVRFVIEFWPENEDSWGAKMLILYRFFQ